MEFVEFSMVHCISWFGCLMLDILCGASVDVWVHCKANTENVVLSWEIFNQAILIELILINFVTNLNNWVAATSSFCMLSIYKIENTLCRACKYPGEIRSWHFWILNIQWLSENEVLPSIEKNGMKWYSSVKYWRDIDFIQHFERLLRILFQSRPILILFPMWSMAFFWIWISDAFSFWLTKITHDFFRLIRSKISQRASKCFRFDMLIPNGGGCFRQHIEKDIE